MVRIHKEFFYGCSHVYTNRVEVSKSIFNKKKKNFEKNFWKKKKKSRKNFDFDIFQFFFVPMGSGVSGIDTSND